jgi:SHS family lactate transporter-like MFS transporter
MRFVDDLRVLNREQRATFLASFLGWTLDAFDFFLLVFVVKAIAAYFHTDVKAVSFAIVLTLAFRPVGAFLFGRLADRYGRRPALMADILLYSCFGLASAFAPSLAVLLVLRALFGIAMGGEWGIGASLAMETIPARSRGVVSGLLQVGYPFGYLLASLVYYALFDRVGWRGMFLVSVVPALLVVYIRMHVKESPAWERMKHRAQRESIFSVLRARWGLAVYSVVLMTALNFLAHGTQDLYPTFLQVQHQLSTHAVGTIAVIYNIGAILGGIFWGTWSERIGRRRAIIAASLMTLPVIPLWAFSSHPALLAAGAFLLQFGVQGAWGVVPAHLNELSPGAVRGTFPGFVYQLGNLLASVNTTLQAGIASSRGGDYAFALALVAAITAVAAAVLTAVGGEAKGQALLGEEPGPVRSRAA